MEEVKNQQPVEVQKQAENQQPAENRQSSENHSPADSRKKDWKKVLDIFIVMFQMGCITYGGGWSIFAQMEEAFADKRGWLTKEDLLDFMSMARSFPGVMVVNLSVMTGYRMAGIPGALAASLGLVSPAFITLSIITYCYEMLISNVWVARALVGVRCAVVPIVLMATIKMKKKAIKDNLAWVLAILSFALCVLTGLNKLMMIIVAAVFGIIVYGVILYGKEQKGGKQ